MKIFIDSGPLTNNHSFRGVGFNTKGLLLGLNQAKQDDVEIITGDAFKSDLSEYDVVHLTSFHPFFLSIPFKKPKNTKFVLTIHDLMQLIYTDVYKPGIKGRIKFLINKFLIKKYIDAIITISETSKKDICRFLDIDPENVHVIYLAPAQREKDSSITKKSVIEKFKLPSKFLLYVGDVNYVKNIPILVKACHEIGINLVMVGKQAKNVGSVDLDHPELNHLQNIDWSKTLRLGFVSDPELTQIYQLALIYIQPSMYEGFGMPVLEAFLNKTPVIAAKTQALVEIADGGALFFDYKSKEDLKTKIHILLEDKNLQNQLIISGQKIVSNYSWKKLGQQTLRVYEKI